MTRERDPKAIDALKEALMRRGASKRIAQRCKISTAAVAQWDVVPESRLWVVSDELGVSAKKLRPDLFKDDAFLLAQA